MNLCRDCDNYKIINNDGACTETRNQNPVNGAPFLTPLQLRVDGGSVLGSEKCGLEAAWFIPKVQAEKVFKTCDTCIFFTEVAPVETSVAAFATITITGKLCGNDENLSLVDKQPMKRCEELRKDIYACGPDGNWYKSRKE